MFSLSLILFVLVNDKIFGCFCSEKLIDTRSLPARYRQAHNIKRFKRSDDFQVPEISLDNTFLDEDDIKEIRNEKLPPIPLSTKHIKYPYYRLFAKHNFLKHSPLRYAESLKNAPHKTAGGTEFYDSKDHIRCSEVQSNVDPIPEHIKNKQPPEDDEEEEGSENDSREIEYPQNERNKRHVQATLLDQIRIKRGFEQHKEQPRLSGLGDKIDCFKDKYFGNNPLDSPFFDEEVIDSPESIHDTFDTMLPFVHIFTKSFNGEHKKPKRDSIKKLPIKIVPKKKIPRENNKGKHTSNNILEILNKETNNDEESDGIYGSPKEKVDLPEVLFKKYLKGNDPRVNVYADVIGNIKANIREDSPKSSAYNSQHAITHVLGQNGNKYEIVPNRLEINIHHDSPSEGNYNNYHYERPERPSKKRYRSVVTSPARVIMNYKNYKKPYRYKRSTKQYKTIGRKERQAQQFSDYDDVINPSTLLADSPTNITTLLANSNNSETIDHSNHRTFYTPITTSNVISPDQLKIEYILRAAAELQRKDELLNKTLFGDTNTEAPFVNIKNIENNTDIQLDNLYPRKTRVNARIKNSNIFDVSAYIPRPVYINAFNLRHNLSSRYLDDETKPADSKEEAQDSVTTLYENNAHNGTFRHTVEVHPSVTLSPDLVTTPIAPIDDIFDGDTNSSYYSPAGGNLYNEKEEGIYTTTTEPYIIFPPYPEEYSTTPSTHGYTQSHSNDSDKIVLNSRTNSRRRQPQYSVDTTEQATALPETTRQPMIRVKNRRTKPKRIKRPNTSENSQTNKYYYENSENNTRKPTILQKTSTKRKTTVITNSRQYMDDEPENPQTNRDFDNKPYETTTFPYKPRVRVPIKKYRKNEEKIVENNNNNNERINPRRKSDYTSRSANSRRSKPKPIKETRKFVEDYQEEEVIQGDNPSYPDENYGPSLASKVNNLSENSSEEVIDDDDSNQRANREGTNANHSDRLQKSAHLDQTIINEGQPHGEYPGSKSQTVIDDKGISARVLRSFVSLFDLSTTTPRFVKDPGERLYFYVKE